MKLKFLLPACAAFAVIAFSSCKKDSISNATEIASTFELSADQTIADNTTQDANDLLNDASVSYNFAGSFTGGPVAQTSFTGGAPAPSSFLPPCATVSVTPLMGFPKTVVIDFGSTGCISGNGITRKGKINITISDSLRKSGSIAVMTFTDYYINNYKKEGTITWTNTSTATVKSWHRVCQNGKITAPGGNYWTHSGAQDIVQSMGASTPATADDEFSVTGSHTLTNAAGVSRTGTILTALKKKTACNWIDSGTYQVQGPNHTATIDFGNGTCDNTGTISIDGQATHTFTMN